MDAGWFFFGGLLRLIGIAIVAGLIIGFLVYRYTGSLGTGIIAGLGVCLVGGVVLGVWNRSV